MASFDVSTPSIFTREVLGFVFLLPRWYDKCFPYGPSISHRSSKLSYLHRRRGTIIEFRDLESRSFDVRRTGWHGSGVADSHLHVNCRIVSSSSLTATKTVKGGDSRTSVVGLRHFECTVGRLSWISRSVVLSLGVSLGR